MGGVGKIEPEVSGFTKWLFFRAPKSLTALNKCLDEMEEFEEIDIAFVSDWFTEKGLQKLKEGLHRNFDCVIRLCHTIK